jgi:hypothetical protein
MIRIFTTGREGERFINVSDVNVVTQRSHGISSYRFKSVAVMLLFRLKLSRAFQNILAS